MTASNNVATPLTKILDWCRTRPKWQQDALRRLVVNGACTPDDVVALTKICMKRWSLLSDDENPEAEPLSEEHLPQSGPDATDVRLSGISQVQFVNALADDQSLSFATDGLTVIYGDNGSGKSGYARILKRACRARSHGGAVRPNVFCDPPEAPANARLSFIDGNEDCAIDWNDGIDSDRALMSVGFFDSDCATVYVDDANDVAFTPFGLDVLPKLAEVCRAVQKELNSIKRKFEAARSSSIREASKDSNTEVARMLRQLSHETNVESIKALASLSPTQKQRKDQLTNDLAAAPKAQALRLRLRAEGINSLAQTISDAATAMSQDRIDALKESALDAANKTDAARTAATELFSEESLPNTGGEVWRLLWEAARRYSTESAYPNKDFPYTDGESLLNNPVEYPAVIGCARRSLPRRGIRLVASSLRNRSSRIR